MLYKIGLYKITCVCFRYIYDLCIGLAKKCLWLLSKNKRHFSFSPRTLLNDVFILLFLLPFFRQLHNSIFLKNLIFLSKELFQVPFTVFQGIEIFSIKRNL